MKSMRPIRKGTHPSSESRDDDRTNIFVAELDGTSKEPVFMRKIFGIQSCWEFYHRCGSCPRVYPEVFKFFPHIVGEISSNYFLIG